MTKPLKFDLFEKASPSGQDLVSLWHERAKDAGDGQRHDSFDTFMRLWCGFNNWAMRVTEADTDADMIRALAESSALNRAFARLFEEHFFETLVRIHRTGENAPYTGLKPAGRDLGPAIPAADKAIETGSDKALIELLTNKVQEGLRKHFKEAVDKKKFAPDDLTAGHEYVEAYVTYIHYVERLYEAAEKPVGGHYHED